MDLSETSLQVCGPLVYFSHVFLISIHFFKIMKSVFISGLYRHAHRKKESIHSYAMFMNIFFDEMNGQRQIYHKVLPICEQRVQVDLH